jgi:7-cyano-7-deazaguanine synthase
MDSTALLASVVSKYDGIMALSVDYGQRHSRELDAANAVATFYDVEWEVLDLSGLAPLLRSALTQHDQPLPEGHYADESMKATVVPGRNAIMLAAAAGVAQSRGASTVLTAVHAGDHPIYPDCRPDFIAAIDHALYLATGVHVAAPFVGVTKTDIARLGATNDAPFDLTWSCYAGGDVHCGRCGTCVERVEAFRESGITDPTTYEVEA